MSRLRTTFCYALQERKHSYCKWRLSTAQEKKDSRTAFVARPSFVAEFYDTLFETVAIDFEIRIDGHSWLCNQNVGSA